MNISVPRWAVASLWCCFVACSLLFLWDYGSFRYFGDAHHMIPLVHLLSGTQEDVPIAYTWTALLAMVSFLGSVLSFSILAFCYCFRVIEKRDASGPRVSV